MSITLRKVIFLVISVGYDPDGGGDFIHEDANYKAFSTNELAQQYIDTQFAEQSNWFKNESEEGEGWVQDWFWDHSIFGDMYDGDDLTSDQMLAILKRNYYQIEAVTIDANV